MLFIKSGCFFFNRSSIVVEDNIVCHCCRIDSTLLCIGQGFAELHLPSLSTQIVNSPPSPVISVSFNKDVFIVFSLIQNPPYGPFNEVNIPSFTNFFITLPIKCLGKASCCAISSSCTLGLFSTAIATYNTPLNAYPNVFEKSIQSKSIRATYLPL